MIWVPVLVMHDDSNRRSQWDLGQPSIPGWVTIQGKAGALGVMAVVALGFQVCHYHHAGSLGVHKN